MTNNHSKTRLIRVGAAVAIGAGAIALYAASGFPRQSVAAVPVQASVIPHAGPLPVQNFEDYSFVFHGPEQAR